MRDFLAALGIGRGDPRGIVVLGGNNAGGGATVSEQVSQAGAECRDSAASGWTFGVYGGDGSIRVAYTPAVGAVSPARTRCPGPLSERTNQRPWVAGTFPATRFGHRSFAITLRASRAAGDAAYLVEPAGSVRLRLKRVVVLRSTLPGSGTGRGSNGMFTGTFFGG